MPFFFFYFKRYQSTLSACLYKKICRVNGFVIRCIMNRTGLPVVPFWGLKVWFSYLFGTRPQRYSTVGSFALLFRVLGRNKYHKRRFVV